MSPVTILCRHCDTSVTSIVYRYHNYALHIERNVIGVQSIQSKSQWPIHNILLACMLCMLMASVLELDAVHRSMTTINITSTRSSNIKLLTPFFFRENCLFVTFPIGRHAKSFSKSSSIQSSVKISAFVTLSDLKNLSVSAESTGVIPVLSTDNCLKSMQELPGIIELRNSDGARRLVHWAEI